MHSFTGRQPFQGDTVADVLASVLAREPDLNTLPRNVNPRLRELLRRTLAKNPKRRFHSIADVRLEIEEALSAPPPVALPAAVPVGKPGLLWKTNESGRSEIVVQPFPVPSGKWQASTSGGIQPRWRADDKELFFIAPDGKLMAASITANGVTFAAGTPVALFSAPLAPSGATNKQQYKVSRDGRFLLNQPVETSSTTPITLILN